MKDEDKRGEQFVSEPAGLRQGIANSEASWIERKSAEEALRFQSQLVENLGAGVKVIRASDGVIVYANRRFEEMFGYGPGELLGKHVSLLNAQRDDKSPREIHTEIGATVNESGVWSGEIQNVKKDGTRFWCRAAISTLESPQQGRVWIGVHEDITEPKRTEEALDRQANLLDKTFNSMADALFILDEEPPGTILDCNEAASIIFGYEKDEMVGRSPAFLHVSDESFHEFNSLPPLGIQDEAQGWERLSLGALDWTGLERRGTADSMYEPLAGRRMKIFSEWGEIHGNAISLREVTVIP